MSNYEKERMAEWLESVRRKILLSSKKTFLRGYKGKMDSALEFKKQEEMQRERKLLGQEGEGETEEKREEMRVVVVIKSPLQKSFLS